jgi:hypothetical protein
MRNACFRSIEVSKDSEPPKQYGLFVSWFPVGPENIVLAKSGCKELNRSSSPFMRRYKVITAMKHLDIQIGAIKK